MAQSKPRTEALSARHGRILAPIRRDIRARYDAAQTTDENRRHFENADSYSANAALMPEIRRKLTNRCRYEVRNNSYAKGIGLTISNDTVGPGPQLNMLLPGQKPLANFIEREFWAWSQAVRLPEKLRLMRMARYDSGEVFAIQTTNPGLDHPVKLDVRLAETEEVADTSLDVEDSSADGIRYDAYGNPTAYHLLDDHPGGMTFTLHAGEGKWIPARYVWHYYHPDRPGQKRGIPDITPAVQLFAELRRYCAAVIAAAETAADYAAVIYSDSAQDVEEEDVETPESMDQIELARRMATVLPKGWKLGQMTAEQPVTTYGEFVGTKLKEIARCLGVPFTIAAMDSSVANMSSAYLDRQSYAAERLIDRAEFDQFLDRIFDQWLTEAVRIPGYLPSIPDSFPHAWGWPSLGHHADPAKVANAREKNLKSGVTNLPLEYAKDGLDWEEQQDAAARSLGVTVPEYQQLLISNLFGRPESQESPIEEPNEDE